MTGKDVDSVWLSDLSGSFDDFLATLVLGCDLDGEVTIALTYMTGTLVKMGQRIAGALLGGPKLAWVRHFLLWIGLLTGCINGAIAHYLVGQGAVWLAALAAAIFALALPFLPLDD